MFYPFQVEQFLSENEQGVSFNFSESGVHPLTLGELKRSGADQEASFVARVTAGSVRMGNPLVTQPLQFPGQARSVDTSARVERHGPPEHLCRHCPAPPVKPHLYNLVQIDHVERDSQNAG